jgi:hypothetical protein
VYNALSLFRKSNLAIVLCIRCNISSWDLRSMSDAIFPYDYRSHALTTNWPEYCLARVINCDTNPTCKLASRARICIQFILVITVACCVVRYQYHLGQSLITVVNKPTLSNINTTLDIPRITSSYIRVITCPPSPNRKAWESWTPSTTKTEIVTRVSSCGRSEPRRPWPVN